MPSYNDWGQGIVDSNPSAPTLLKKEGYHSLLFFYQMKDYKIFAVIPAYNAAKTIKQVVGELQKCLPEILIIIVNDGSFDETATILKELDVITIEHTNNLGKGAALRNGIRRALEAGGEFIFTIDSDNQHNPVDCRKLLNELLEQNLDLVIGSRMGNKGKMPFSRQISNRVTSKFVSWRIRQKIADSQSGFRLYRAQLLQSIKLSSTQFEIESEMLIKAALKGFKIGTINIETIYTYNQTSYIKAIDIFRFLKLYFQSFSW